LKCDFKIRQHRHHENRRHSAYSVSMDRRAIQQKKGKGEAPPRSITTEFSTVASLEY
jgi:hypothetical protein